MKTTETQSTLVRVHVVLFLSVCVLYVRKQNQNAPKRHTKKVGFIRVLKGFRDIDIRRQ